MPEPEAHQSIDFAEIANAVGPSALDPNSAIGVFVETNGVARYANARLLALSGCERLEDLDLVLNGRVTGESGPRVVDLGRRSGTMRALFTRVGALRDGAGCWIAQEIPSSAELDFGRFVELSPQPTWVTDAQGAFLALSPLWTEWTGMSAEETFAYSWVELVHPEEREALVEGWRRSLASGAPLDVEFRLRMRDGAFRWARSRAYPDRDDEGRVRRWYGATEDVHERTEAERARRETEARLRQLADAMPQLVWTANGDGEVDYYNAQRTRYAAENGDPLAWAPLVHPEDLARTVEAWETARTAGSPYACEHRLKMADGSWAWHLSRALPAVDRSGVVRQWFGTATDIDALKNNEAHRTLLIRELDHRVRNTLSIVQALVRQSLRDGQPVAVSRVALEGRLAALAAAHGLLTRKSWRSLELAAVFQEVMAPHGLERSVAEGPPLLLEPRTAVAFALAFHELATNALKYGALSNETGRVRVDWRVTGRTLAFFWREEGGPPVSPPTRRGFGSRMLEAALADELSGRIALRFKPSGLECEIEALLPG